MARITIGLTLDVVLLDELCAQLRLIGRILILDIKNLVERPDIFRRIPMTVETKGHLERLRFPHQRHLIHRSVTARTTDAFVDVNAVIEIDIVGELIHAVPHDRLIGLKALAHQRECTAGGPDLAMTIHTGLRGRHPGKRGILNRGMTITAVNAVVADVVFVTKGNGLIDRSPDTGKVR